MAVPTMTNNSPVAGSIAWAAFNIQYGGVSYQIAAGSTAQRWVWWRYNGGGVNSIIEAGADLPQDLADDDLVLFGNKNGLAVRIQSSSLIDGELIVDGSILAKALDAEAVTADHLTAGDALIEGLLRVQATVADIIQTKGLAIGTSSWTEEGGINVPDVMNIPVDGALGAYLIAEFTANRLSIKDYFKLMGKINSVAQGAELVLDSGVEDPPKTPPLLSNAWEQDGSIPDTSVIGLWKAAKGDYVTLEAGVPGIFSGAIARWKDGVRTQYTVLDDPANSWEFEPKALSWWSTNLNSGVAGQTGGYYYVIGKTSSPDDSWYMYKIDSNLVLIGRYYIGGSNYFTNRPALLPVSKDIVNHVWQVAGWKSDGTLALYEFDVDTMAMGTKRTLTGHSTPFDIMGASGEGLIPGGSDLDNHIVLWREAAGAVVFRAIGLAKSSTVTVPRAYGKSVRGAGGAYGLSTLDENGAVWNYASEKQSGSIAYSWADAHDTTGAVEHETALSASADASTIGRGAFIGFTIPPVPDSGDADSPNEALLYGRKGTNPFKVQGFTTKTTSFLYSIREDLGGWGLYPSFAGTTLTSARVRSAGADGAGSLVDFKGDGSWRLGDLLGLKTGRFTFPISSTQNPTGTTYTAGQVTFVRQGQIVRAFGYVDRSGFNNASHPIPGITIPVGMRPAATVTGKAGIAYGGTATYRYRFFADGTVEVQQSAQVGVFQTFDEMWIAA